MTLMQDTFTVSDTQSVKFSAKERPKKAPRGKITREELPDRPGEAPIDRRIGPKVNRQAAIGDRARRKMGRPSSNEEAASEG